MICADVDIHIYIYVCICICVCCDPGFHASKGWIVNPQVNRTAFFDGRLLHCVLPGSGPRYVYVYTYIHIYIYMIIRVIRAIRVFGFITEGCSIPLYVYILCVSLSLDIYIHIITLMTLITLHI